MMPLAGKRTGWHNQLAGGVGGMSGWWEGLVAAGTVSWQKGLVAQVSWQEGLGATSWQVGLVAAGTAG